MRGRPSLLMTPGPTRVPARVLDAAHWVVHHRTADFSAALAETLTRLRPFFGAATADVLPVHATGRAAMEGAIANFFAPGDTVVACCNGKFGEMWAGFAESYGLDVRRVSENWEESVDPSEVEQVLRGPDRVRAVLCCHSDTSTGVLNPIEDIARVARTHDALVMVDGISSVGGVPFRFDGWDLDFAVTSSQKCLMSSPGLAFAVVGARAWSAVARSPFPKNYLSFSAIRKTLAGEQPETPGTTPVSLVLQVLEALRMHAEEGMDSVFARHQAMADHAAARADALGFGRQCPGLQQRSPTLTALTPPEGVAPKWLRTRVREMGIEIAVGMGHFAGAGVRIGHMGDIRMADVGRTMDAIEAALA